MFKEDCENPMFADFEIREYRLPEDWASYLINNDLSGYDDDEIAEIETWEKKVKPGYCVLVSESEGFCATNDAHTSAGKCAIFTFHRELIF